jgi:ADP-ribose pyrophosphatase
VSKLVKHYDCGFFKVFERDGYYYVSRDEDQDKLTKPNAVHIVGLTQDEDELIAIKQFRPAINDFVLDIPAGLVDNDESIYEAAARELQEETGYAFEAHFSTEPMYAAIGLTNETSCLVVGTAISTENAGQCIDENEKIEVMKINLNDLVDSRIITSNKVTMPFMLAREILIWDM